MRQVEYRGYARGQGFNPIQAPDTTRKIAQRDQAYAQGMERYAAQLESNRKDYAAGMQRKFATEANNRSSNFEWAQSEADRYQRGVLQNIEVERQNAASALQNVGRDRGALEALSGLSETLTKGIADYTKNVTLQQEVEGKNFVFENGLTPDVMQRYEQQKAALSQSDARLNSVVNQLEFEGVPTSVLEQYRSLSGWKKYGAMSAMALQGADNYPVYALKARDTLELDIGNGPFTLETARNIEEYKAAEAAIRSEYLKNFVGINDALLAENLFPGMRQYEANERSQFISKYEKNIEARVQGERVSDLISSSRTTGGQGFLDWVNRYSGGDRNLIGPVREEGFSALSEAIKTGEMSPGEWQAIKDYEFVPFGQSKPTTIGEYYKGGVAQVDNAVAKKEKEAYEQRQVDRQMANEEFDEMVREALFGPTPPTEQDLEQIEEQYQRNGFRVPEFLKSYRSQEDKSREDKKAQLITYSNVNALDTETLFRVAGRDQELIAEFKSRAQEGDQLAGLNKGQVDQSLKLIEARMFELLEQTGVDKKNSSAFLSGMQRAETEFNRKLKTELRQHGDEALAIQQAQDFVMTQMWNGMGADPAKRNGPFTIPDDRKGSLNPFASMGQAQPIAELTRRMTQLKPGQWRTQSVLKPNELAEVERFRDGKGQMPSIILQMARKTGQSPIDLMDAQLNIAGKPLLVPVESELVRRSMSPQMQRILQFRPSAGNTYQAFGMNPGDGVQPWRPLLDLIASKESTSYGGYDAMNTGGANDGMTAFGSANSREVFPGGLTSMTVAQVMDLHNKGQLHAAGRYQIIAKTMRGLVQGSYGPTGVDPNDRFDAATQDKLAIALVRGRAGKFFSGTGSLENAVTGMGNEWRGLRNLSRQKVADMLERTRTTLNSPSPFRQPEAMRSNVVYKIDSLGYGSTGPHLDVKPVRPGSMQSDRNLPAYRKGELDQFVEITLPNGKRGALSQLSTTTDDDAKHRARARSSFGHDYAAPKGSQLKLKNGARAVGSFKGDQGTDHLIIELPDGRRYQFLHGTIG